MLTRDNNGWHFLRDETGNCRWLDIPPAQLMQWLPDSRRVLADEGGRGLIGYDIDRLKRLGTLRPSLPGDHWICISPTGHYRGSPSVESLIVYVAQTESGEYVTLSPDVFQTRFGWRNDPTRAKLLATAESPQPR